MGDGGGGCTALLLHLEVQQAMGWMGDYQGLGGGGGMECSVVVLEFYRSVVAT